MRPVVRLLLTCAAILTTTSAMAQTVTPASAAASAAQAAPAPTQVRSWLTLTEQQSKFGTYTAGANEARFGGGKGDARPDGATRKAGCTGSTTDPECLAIQALQNARASPSTWVPPNSPQLVGRNAVVSNPQGVLGFDPVAAAGATASVQCRTETVRTPEVREENHCVVSAPGAELTCSLGVEVEVDPDYVYKCLTRTATNSSTTCSVGQVVTVDSTTTYKCVERLRSNLPNACTVNRIVEVDADTKYQCVNQVRQASDTQCTVGNVVEVRADTNYQCVEQARAVANAACTVGQVVTIDPRFNYRCTSTPNAVTTNTCARKLSVSCSNACVHGLGIEVTNNVPGDLLTKGFDFVEVRRFYMSSTALSMNLTIQGSLTGPVMFEPKYWTDSNGLPLANVSYEITINGATLPSTYARPVDITPYITVGTAQTLSFRPIYYSGASAPVIRIVLPGQICTTTCTDTWDESECAPYKARLQAPT
jgi:hypothetical protein